MCLMEGRTSPASIRRSRQEVSGEAGTARSAKLREGPRQVLPVVLRKKVASHRANGVKAESAMALRVTARPNRSLALMRVRPHPVQHVPPVKREVGMAVEEGGKAPNRTVLLQVVVPSPATRETHCADPRRARAVDGRMFGKCGIPRRCPSAQRL